MASSFLEYQGENIRLNDFSLAFIFSLLVKVGRELEGRQEIFDVWEEMLSVGGPGLYDFDLGGHWETLLGRRELLGLLTRVRAILVEEGKRIGEKRANELLLTDRFQCRELESSEISDVLDRIENLISWD